MDASATNEFQDEEAPFNQDTVYESKRQEIAIQANLARRKTHGKSDLRKVEPRHPIPVDVDPSLNETLAKKLAIAEELEDKVQCIRSRHEEKIQSADRINQNIADREKLLVQSLQKIEGYVQEMYALKRKAEEMFLKCKGIEKDSELELQNFMDECENTELQKTSLSQLIESFKPVKTYMEDIVCKSPRYKSAKDFVRYSLVLELLHDDLSGEDARFVAETRRDERERRGLAERTRNHPMAVLTKEDELNKIKLQIKDERLENVQLEHQVRNLMSAQVKEELTWSSVVKWIGAAQKTATRALPIEHEGSAVEVADQLQRIHDFVLIGTQLVKRLKEGTK